MDKPPVVSAEEWQQARAALLTDEKQATRTLDAIAAQRRRLPMVKFRSDYEFASPFGIKTLLDLFDGRPSWPPTSSWTTVPTTSARAVPTSPTTWSTWPPWPMNDVSWVTVSDMPLEQMQAYWERMGWTVPFVSSRGTTFAQDCGAGGGFVLTLFLRDGDDVYRTYAATTARPRPRCDPSAPLIASTRRPGPHSPAAPRSPAAPPIVKDLGGFGLGGDFGAL